MNLRAGNRPRVRRALEVIEDDFAIQFIELFNHPQTLACVGFEKNACTA